jgi:hypothetical protein
MAYLAVLLGLMGNSEEQGEEQEGIAAAGVWVKHVQYTRRYYAVIETAAEAGAVEATAGAGAWMAVKTYGDARVWTAQQQVRAVEEG